MTALEYFRLLAPEFSAVLDATVNSWLTIAGNLFVADCLDSERLAMATALYAAHMLKLSTLSAGGGAVPAGPLIREKEGDLEREYAQGITASSSGSLMNSTVYGKQFLDITRPCGGIGIMTRIDENVSC